MGRKRRPPEQCAGGFAALPWVVLDSKAFQEAGYASRSLLMELARQLNGSNNGHLQLTRSWLAPRGWTSDQTIQASKTELQNLGLIQQTRQGGKGIGPSRFAVTWLPISNFQGLEIGPKDFRRSAFMRQPLVLPPRENHRSSFRSDSALASGVSPPSITPPSGPKTAYLVNFSAPKSGNNVIDHAPTGNSGGRIVVGRKGRSGIPGSGQHRPVAQGSQ
jgi:hypothetical protein